MILDYKGIYIQKVYLWLIMKWEGGEYMRGWMNGLGDDRA